MEKGQSQVEPAAAATTERLEGWKEIAAYLNRTVCTVQRWEKEERLPVRRHQHHKLGSVSACKTQLDEWMKRRQTPPAETAASVSFPAPPEPAVEAVEEAAPAFVPQVRPWRLPRRTLVAALLAGLLTFPAAAYWALRSSHLSSTNATRAATRNPAAYEAYLGASLVRSIQN